MLRFAVGSPPADLVLELNVRPYLDTETPRQRIEVSANGHPLETLELTEEAPTTPRVVIPSDVVGTAEWLDITFTYPDARPLTAAGSGKRFYALFLYHLRLTTAVD